jgi:hypothetical protein
VNSLSHIAFPSPYSELRKSEFLSKGNSDIKREKLYHAERYCAAPSALE